MLENICLFVNDYYDRIIIIVDLISHGQKHLITTLKQIRL